MTLKQMRKHSKSQYKLFFILPFLFLLADAFAAPLEIDVQKDFCPDEGLAELVQSSSEESSKFKERLENCSLFPQRLCYILTILDKCLVTYLSDDHFLYSNKNIVNISLSERGPPALLQ